MTSNSKAEELLASSFFEDRTLAEIEAFDPGFFFGMTPVAAEPRRLNCCL